MERIKRKRRRKLRERATERGRGEREGKRESRGWWKGERSVELEDEIGRAHV